MKLKSNTFISAAALLFASALLPFSGISAAEAAAAKGGVITAANPDSRTGFTTTFTYVDREATNVQLTGGFMFYVTNDPKVYANGFTLTGNDNVTNYYYEPQEWEKDLNLSHVSDAGYTTDMTCDDKTGEWVTSLDLPCASYLYQYKVSYDGGETYETIADPANPAKCNEFGANQTRSQFYVPFDAEKQNPSDDWSWLTPLEDSSARGQIVYTSYTGFDAKEQPLEIYLPANYDPDREEPYKVLYLSHGGGGEEGDWFYQGNAANIIDRAISSGSCEEFLTVCMNNSRIVVEKSDQYPDWDYDAVYDNIKDYLLPYIEENYNVSSSAADRALAGLSRGAKNICLIYYKEPELFGYYGLFSGTMAGDWPTADDYSSYKNTNLYLAAGFADHMMMHVSYHTETDKTLIGLKELLDANEIPYNNGHDYVTVQGGHDWFTWPQILKDYLETTLWK